MKFPSLAPALDASDVAAEPGKRARKRTLYELRHYMTVDGAGRCVGRKSRLLPRTQALRIVARLTKRGIDCHAWPLQVTQYA